MTKRDSNEGNEMATRNTESKNKAKRNNINLYIQQLTKQQEKHKGYIHI